MDKGQIIHCYNATADAYASELFDELSHKPLDRILLAAFAAENKEKGTLIDLGCGPGQTSRFLADAGMSDILGIDLSPAMVQKANDLNPDLIFEVADMLDLPYGDARFGSALAFYAIVHFNKEELAKAFSEVHRVLIPGGQLLISFHIGDEVVHRDEFFGEVVDVDFCFFRTEEVLEVLRETGFKVISAIERLPYAGFEYASKRAYLWVER